MTDDLKLVTVERARQIIQAHMGQSVSEYEIVPVDQSVGRVCAQNLQVSDPYPPFTRSAMDGYAVCAAETFGCNRDRPALFQIATEILMGHQAFALPGADYASLIHTGGMLPENADAVVVVEETEIDSDGQVLVYQSVNAGENVIYQGEDVQVGDPLLAWGKRISAVDAGALATSGIMQIPVFRKVRVGIISMGDELVAPEEALEFGQIRDINTILLSTLCRNFNAEVAYVERVKDHPEALLAALQATQSTCDFVFITAGSSVSSRDFTAEVVQQYGDPGVLFHGINIRPGKPSIFARCENQFVFGLPGNPVSAYVIAWLFGMPILKNLAGESTDTGPLPIQATLDTNVPSKYGRTDYVPVKLKEDNGNILATPVFFKSNLIFSLARADGLMYIPEGTTGISAGERVMVYLHTQSY